MKLFLDTHAAVFLWEGRVEAFGAAAVDAMEWSALFVSPMVRIEMQFLWEVGKLRVQAGEILGALAAERGLIEAGDPIQAVVGRAMALNWTRDLFDRMIVATALLHRAPLVTRDGRIREHYELAIW